MEHSGIVVKNTGNQYWVERTDDGRVFVCRIKGRFRMQGIRTTNPLAVGDRVRFGEGEGDDHVITRIEPRRNYIIRKSTNLSKEAHIIAANVDQVFLVVTLDYPVTSYEFIDRFLVTAELYKIPVILLLNKTDLFVDGAYEEMEAVYALAGYPTVRCSAETGEGIGTVRQLMQGKISLFSGNSGVGKSSLIRLLAPELEAEIRTGGVSEVHQKGKHTTTFSQMFKLSEGTYLIDTPGIKGFGLIDIEDKEVARYFPDLFCHASECRFYNCTHTHEPGCAVKRLVEEGKIAPQRYDSYLRIIEDEKDKYRK